MSQYYYKTVTIRNKFVTTICYKFITKFVNIFVTFIGGVGEGRVGERFNFFVIFS